MTPAERLAVTVAHPRWGGGVHVTHLAELLGYRVGDGRLWWMIKQARDRGLIDTWRGWVIAEDAARTLPFVASYRRKRS